ncbi:MAG: hypothetical protein LBD31_10870 [Treponema sp.]|jgi:hypothetical protein|nr:hypothetical protein [Treponema sp.]
MGRYAVKKWLSYAAAVYLALATMGMFTFMSLDAPRILKTPQVPITDKSVFLTAVTCPVECLLATRAAKDHSFSPLRHGSLRAGTPAGAFTAGTGLLYTAVRLIAKAAVHNIKSTILLKLRI